MQTRKSCRGEDYFLCQGAVKRRRVLKERTSANFLAKKKIVSEIEQKLRDAKSVIFMDYRGLTVAEDTTLRNKFRAKGISYKVYKNNLVKLALKNYGVTDLDDKLTGTLSVAFSNADEVSAAKIIQDEKLKDKMAFKFGLLGTSILDANGVQSLATMPSKEQLIAQLLGLLQSGSRGIAGVVHAVPRNLAVVIKQAKAR